MSGNDCWNRVCFSCWWKAENELADVTLSGSLFQNCTAATGNARPPTVDSLNGGICRRFDPAERSASHVFPFASPIIQPSVFWPGLLLGLLSTDTRTTWHALMVSCRVVTTWSQKLVTWAAYASAGCVIQSQITADSFVHVLQPTPISRACQQQQIMNHRVDICPLTICASALQSMHSTGHRTTVQHLHNQVANKPTAIIHCILSVPINRVYM